MYNFLMLYIFQESVQDFFEAAPAPCFSFLQPAPAQIGQEHASPSCSSSKRPRTCVSFLLQLQETKNMRLLPAPAPRDQEHASPSGSGSSALAMPLINRANYNHLYIWLIQYSSYQLISEHTLHKMGQATRKQSSFIHYVPEWVAQQYYRLQNGLNYSHSPVGPLTLKSIYLS